MRFMMLMYPDPLAETGAMPDKSLVEAMMRYNEDLAKAGVLIALDGLHPSSKGARVRFPGGKAQVSDGPFTEAKELIGGYWLLRVKSRQEALAWAARVPPHGSSFVELREVFEPADFPAELQGVIDDSAVRAAASERGRT